MDDAAATRITVPTPPAARPGGGARRRRLWPILAVVLAAAVLGWRYILPTEVEAMIAAVAPLAMTVSGPALVDALTKVEVSPRVQGRIVALAAEQGDVLRAGAPIARLDAPDTASQLDQARAEAEAARRSVAQAESDRDSARAAMVRAQAEFDRKADLLRRGFASRSDYDAARAGLDQAAAGLAHAEVGVPRAQSSLASAEAAVQVVAARLADSTIVAPIDGVVAQRMQSLGDLATPGAAILQMVDPASLILSARMDESVMAGLGPGQAVEIRYVSFPGRVFGGRVLRLGRSVDTTTREFTVDVVPIELPPHWAIGQRATVTVLTGTRPAVIAVPQTALAPRNGRSGLWVAGAGMRARWRPIRLGLADGASIEVTEGLAAGDIVLLRPGRVHAWEKLRPVFVAGAGA